MTLLERSAFAGPPSFVFQGGGFGHAIGMSQYGALGRARAGHSYDQILKSYYTGVGVGVGRPIPQTIRVGLRQADGGFRLSGNGTFSFSTSIDGPSMATGGTDEWWEIQRQGSSVFLIAPAGRVQQGEPQTRGPFPEIWQRAAAGVRLKLVEYSPSSSGWAVTGEYAHGSIQTLASPDSSTTHVVLANLSLEHYVYGVAEVPSSWPMEAKKAQASAARTYAARKAELSQMRSTCSCAVFDDTRDQVYAGWVKETPAWTSAVDATAGSVVTYGSDLAQTFYSSSSGGYTEDNEKVWGGSAIPYLRAVPDSYDNQPENSRWRWTITLSGDEVANRINSYLTSLGRPQVGSVEGLYYPAPRGHANRIIVISGGGGGVTVLGSAGQARLNGEQFRSALKLPSALVFPSLNEPTIDVSGGVVIDARGGVHPFGGGTPPNGGAYFSDSIVRDAVYRKDGRGGYELTGLGGIFRFDTAPDLGTTPGFGSDIARSIALTPDGKGAYILDGFGGIHRVGEAPPLSGAPYWNGWDIAKAIAINSDGKGGYVLDGFGGVHPLGNAPPVTGIPYFGFDIARDLTLRADGVSGYVLDGWGGIHPLGGAPGLSSNGYHAGLDTAAALVLRDMASGGYVLERSGILIPVGGAPQVATSTYFDNNSARAVLMPPDPHGHVLAGTGEVEPFGVAAKLSGGPSFGGDIARDLALRKNGTGVVLDGLGGLHPIGTGATAPTGGAYFPGQDRVRRVSLTPDGKYGYSMDRNGTLYAFDGAPSVTQTADWWPDDWDIARDLVLRSVGGGYLVDQGGLVHNFGGAPEVQTGYIDNADVARAIALLPDESSGYVLGQNGQVYPFGGAPNLETGIRIPDARDLILRSDGRSGWIIGPSALYPFGGAPPVSGGLPTSVAARAGASA